MMSENESKIETQAVKAGRQSGRFASAIHVSIKNKVPGRFASAIDAYADSY